MEWTKQDEENLLKWIDYRDSDDIKIKKRIAEELVKNKNIIYLLNNKELDSKDEYININIFPYYNVDLTQTHVDNFICFETQWTEEQRYNDRMKLQQLVFYILCHVDNVTDELTGLTRHDLIAALITDQFNWTNILGNKMHCVSSRPSTVDNKYVTRTLIFEQITNNNLVKTPKAGTPRLANKDIVLSTPSEDEDE